jgi:hypothetical protein
MPQTLLLLSLPVYSSPLWRTRVHFGRVPNPERFFTTEGTEHTEILEEKREKSR